MNLSVWKPSIYHAYHSWGLQTPQSVSGFVVFHHNSNSKPNQMQEYHIWVCASQSPQKNNHNTEAICIEK